MRMRIWILTVVMVLGLVSGAFAQEKIVGIYTDPLELYAWHFDDTGDSCTVYTAGFPTGQCRIVYTGPDTLKLIPSAKGTQEIRIQYKLSGNKLTIKDLDSNKKPGWMIRREPGTVVTILGPLY